MTCNCHQDSNSGSSSQQITPQDVAMPCDLETLARLQAEYLPQTPPPTGPDPSEARTARQLVHQANIKLKPGARRMLDAQLTPRAYFERLLDKEFLAEARRILAHALPKRRALWWACLCAQDAYQNSLPDEVRVAVEAVVQFVTNPSEVNRRQAERIGRGLPPNELAGCLAMAAFFTEGSVSKPGLPAVAPRPFVTGRLVGVCVYLASVTRSATRYKDYLRQYLTLGVEIARGRNLWQEPRSESKSAPVRVDTASNVQGSGSCPHGSMPQSHLAPGVTSHVE